MGAWNVTDRSSPFHWRRPMLMYRRTSILESPAQTLVNTVNCVGVMGKGLAHAFKEREPEMFKAYKRICDQDALAPGKLWLWRGSCNWVLNFPTKVHWKNASRIEWIEQGLAKFVAAFSSQGITEISFPRLGCGNGNLEWDEVRPVMEKHLSKISIPIYIHDHTVDVGLPEHLEAVANELRKRSDADWSFSSFVSCIGDALTFTGGQFSTLGNDEAFSASLDSDHVLSIETSESKSVLEEDDLRGVWLELQSGLVTRSKAGWAASGGGEPLLSLLSVLPNVRPVEIQRQGSALPEYAVEPTPESRGLASTGQTKEQHELAWH